MKNRKTKSMIACLALVGVIGLGSTFAYLTSQSNTLKNTFTVGQGYIPDPDHDNQAVWIDEQDIKKTDGSRTEKGNEYTNILPGDKLVKDPELNVNKASVKSYVYMQVTGLDALAEKGITTVINAPTNDKEGWVAYDVKDGKLDGIYVYAKGNNDPAIVDPTDKTATTTPLFSNLSVASDFNVKDENGNTVNLDNVVIRGCAVQAVTTTNGSESVIPFEQSDKPTFE